MKYNIFIEIKKFFNNDAINFLYIILRKRKKYLFFNIFSGISSAGLELIILSLLGFFLNILSLEDTKTFDWENIDILSNFNFIVNFLNRIPFISIFIITIIFLLLLQITQASFPYHF